MDVNFRHDILDSCLFMGTAKENDLFSVLGVVSSWNFELTVHHSSYFYDREELWILAPNWMIPAASIICLYGKNTEPFSYKMT